MSLDAVKFLALNASQAGGALLFLLAAHGFGALLLRLTNLRRPGVGGICLDILCGLAVLTGLSGWLALGWVFTRPMGYAVLSAGWIISVFVVVQDLYRRPPFHTPSSTLAGVKRAAWTERIVCIAVLSLAALLGLWAYAHQFAWADDWRYHLTLPRRILADAGYRYDSFMPEANFNYGGEHGLHALMLLLGGEVTYQMLSPAAALLLLSGILYAFLRPRYGVVSSAAALAAMLGCGFFWRMGFITLTPDVLMAAMVAALAWMLLTRATTRRHIGAGILCGLLLAALIALKKIYVFAIPLVPAGYVLSHWSAGRFRVRWGVRFACGLAIGFAVALLPWVLIEWRNTGSPFYAFIGDRRHVNSWLLERDLVLLDAPLGIAVWMWQLVKVQYLQPIGGLLWIYAIVALTLVARRGARRGASVQSRARLTRQRLPILMMLPATLVMSAYFIYSRGVNFDVHIRYMIPMALPAVAIVVAWALERYRSGRMSLPAWRVMAADLGLAVILAGNFWQSWDSIKTRVVSPVLGTVRNLAWHDVSGGFWRRQAKDPPYQDFHRLVPEGSKVLTYVRKSAIIDQGRYEVDSIGITLSGVVDVHRLREPRALLAALRSEGYEYVFVTFEWLQAEKWSREQDPTKRTVWSAYARTLRNLIRLRELDDVETVRSYSDALILRLNGAESSPGKELTRSN